MATRKVLIISFDFPPQGGTGAIRVTKFVKYLPEFGWDPVVVCSDTMWNPDESLARDVPPHVPVYRVGWPRWVQRLRPQPPVVGPTPSALPAESAKQSLRHRLVALARQVLIPDTNRLWVSSAVRQSRELIAHGDIDAILTTSPPHSVQLVGLRLKRAFPHIPWIADFRDLWSQSDLIVDTGLRAHMNYRMETQCLSHADRVLLVTDGIRSLTLQEFPPAVIDGSKAITLTNGYDPDDNVPGVGLPHNDRLTLTFTGSLFGPRSGTQLIPALNELMNNDALRKRIQVRLVGFIPDSVQAQVESLCRRGVIVVRPPVSHQEALTEIAQADALLLIEADTPELRLNHSNKLFEYLAAGKPILGIVAPGEASRVIEEEHAGIVVHPDNREQIKRAILELLGSYNRGDLADLPSPDKYARFQRRNLTRSLADILSGLNADTIKHS